MPPAESEIVISKFGPVTKGSVLSYLQMLDQDYIIQYPGVDFPDLPSSHYQLHIWEINCFTVLGSSNAQRFQPFSSLFFGFV